MLIIPDENSRIEDREIIPNLNEICRKIVDILDSSETVSRKQRELDSRPGGRKYSLVTLFLLYVIKELRRSRFDDVRYNLDDDISEIIRLPKRKDGRWRSPRGSTIAEFKRDIMEPMLDQLFAELAVAMMDRIKVVHRGDGYVVVTIDSTPAEASRYNFDADFNTHYMVRMDKMNIIMIDGMPLFMIPTRGNAGENEPMEDLFTFFDTCTTQSGLDRGMLKVMADSGYDSFLSFDTVHRHTGAVMNCPVRAGAAYHEEATWSNLQKAYSRLYRKPGFHPDKKNDRQFVLGFLRKNGLNELVGKHLRNLEMERMRKQLEEGIKDTDREVCEVVHHSMKSWVDFTTKKIRHATRHVSLKCKFLVVQLLSVIFKGYVRIG